MSSETARRPSTGSSWADWAGITASTLCMLHCVALPLLALALPALATHEEPWLHGALLALVGLLAVLAFVFGGAPRRLLGLAALGLGFLAAPLLLKAAPSPWSGPVVERVSTLAGSAALVIAHWYNRRRACPCPDRAEP